jgi:hypothetical protein
MDYQTSDLIKLFQEHKFTIKIDYVFLDSGYADVQLQFYNLTPSPIFVQNGEIIKGSDRITSVKTCINFYHLLEYDDKPIKTVDGWISGILMPYMRTMLMHGLTFGQIYDESYFRCAEIVLDYYFYYLTICPRVDVEIINGVEYKNQVGLKLDQQTRIELLDLFVLNSTRNVADLGIDAVHFANLMRKEIGKNVCSEQDQVKLQNSLDLIENTKFEAKLLAKSLYQEDKIEELKNRAKRIRFR